MLNSACQTHAPSFDVVLIGGGPAGSTVATLLAHWGKRVLVLEKEHFPRHHIGESLLAGTVALMKRLGVYDKVAQAGFVRKFGATYIWGKSEEPWSILFSEVSDEDRYSFQVERSKFDQLLLEHSREMGATVQEGCYVTGFVRDNERITGVHYVDGQGTSHTVNCQFCVDASGQNALLGTAMKWRDFNKTLRNFAIYGYYQGGKSPTELIPNLRAQDHGNIFVVAMEKGWIWYIPLQENRHSVGIVTHASLAKELNKEKRFQFYQDCLNSTPQIRYLLSEATLESPSLYTQSDWSYVCKHFKGPGYLLVGDAACFVDPILSTGVDLAMEGGFSAAIALNTILDDPTLTEQSLQWYEEEYKTKATHFLQMAEHWYHGHRARDSWFWQAKQLVEPDSNLSMRQAFILLTGGFTTGTGEEDLQALKSFGGFRPFQLRTIYEHLCNDFEQYSAAASPTSPRKDSSGGPREISLSEMFEGFPRLKQDITYRPYMMVQNDHLVPIVQLVQHIEGIAHTKLVLPTAALPLLQLIDGNHSTQQIAGKLIQWRDQHASNTTLAQEQVLSLVQELFAQRAIDLHPQKVS